VQITEIRRPEQTLLTTVDRLYKHGLRSRLYDYVLPPEDDRKSTL